MHNWVSDFKYYSLNQSFLAFKTNVYISELHNVDHSEYFLVKIILIYIINSLQNHPV